jgi:hypothetical protein
MGVGPPRQPGRMNRKTFLTLASVIALAVGTFAVAAPGLLLNGKGVAPAAAAVASIWVREVGVLLLALGATTFVVRSHDASPTLRAFLIGNVVVQLGLLPIELSAYASGLIANLSGVAPNSVLHVVLAGAFAYFVATMGPEAGQGARTRS